jgi:hypothetical protein
MFVSVPTVTARYYPNPQKSLERQLFAADVNPTPLLEVVAQELAYRAKGKVTVYIEADSDIYSLRNILKVSFVCVQDQYRLRWVGLIGRGVRKVR